ncbi:MAG: hypothetical protein B7Y39_05520 [Bdellovibrio sp. 28-41-41]|nr:MAG: hypothetical protein B7Y39_05520 [Bdellovibrio sp. 28-41-41]
MIQISDHLEKLPIFLEVVKTGSIRAASKKLNISQPSVSRTIQILEESVSHRLLVRGQNGVQITEYGQRLLDLAQKIKNEVDLFEQRGATKDVEVQKVKFGTYESIAVYFFPNFLNHLAKVKSQVNVDLLTATSDQLVDYLRRNIVDAILSVNVPAYSSIISKKLFDDYYGFYHSPLLTFEPNTPIIFFPNAKDFDGKKISSFIKETSLKNNPQFLCESFEPIRALTKANLGLGILPSRVASEDLNTGKLVEWNQEKGRTKKFGKHTVFFSFLKHRIGDERLIKLLQEIEKFELKL